MFYKVGALKTFAKFTEKHLRRTNFNVYKYIGWDPATFTSSKSAVETLENGVKYIPVETLEKGVKMFKVVVSLLLTLNIFQTFS